MLGAYGWAFTNPVRKLYYNLTITGMSVVVAVLRFGGVEALGLVAGQLRLAGGLGTSVNAANGNLGTLSYVIIAVFVMSWGLSMLVYRLMGYDKIGSA